MKKMGQVAEKVAEGPIDSDQFDKKGLVELGKMKARVSERWILGTNDLLAEKNLALLEKINSFESRIDSMLRIPVKPKELENRWDEMLNEYERTLNQAIAYATRHRSVGVAE